MQQTTSRMVVPARAAARPRAQAGTRLRLDVLDGIRGLAALYVALFHAANYAGYSTTPASDLSAPMGWLAWVLGFGTFAVPVFIVLSGFCLMLPLAQQHSTALQGGATRYIQRRAWRILPSYYAVLLLSLGLIALVPILQAPHNTAWDTKLPITAGSIVAHLLLVHNFSPDWIFKIDGPMWSIAIEWQIYFLFPAVLLPVLRRSSMAVTVGLAMLLGLLPHFVLPNALNIDYTHPWFVGLFAFGMAAAALAYSSHPAVALPHARRRWGWLIALLTLALAAGLALNKQWMEWHAYITEPVAGLIVAYWLIEYTRALRDGTRRPFSQRLLESRMLVGLGAFSYSLYLVHNPIQALINLESLKLAMPADARLALMLGVATPLSLLCAYGFYLLVERRCLRMNERVTPDGDA